MRYISCYLWLKVGDLLTCMDKFGFTREIFAILRRNSSSLCLFLTRICQKITFLAAILTISLGNSAFFPAVPAFVHPLLVGWERFFTKSIYDIFFKRCWDTSPIFVMDRCKVYLELI